MAKTDQHEKAVEALRAGIRQFQSLFPGGARAHGGESLQEPYRELIGSLRALNRPVETAQAINEYRALVNGDSIGLYNLACELVRCLGIEPAAARRKTLTDEAITALRAAMAAGWSNAVQTCRDPDLVPLHDRDDFRWIVEKLFDRGFPTDPFAR